MSSPVSIRAETARLLAYFESSGAQLIEADILQPADTLLDLYGEDIRARAFVTHDPLNGERMLRPDFTVPVVQKHMTQGAEPARYTYAGKVFRRQENSNARASEYIQVGYEVFDRSDPIAADAEVFAMFNDILQNFGLRAATGDIAIIKAAVLGLKTTQRRKNALLRHIWRPERFKSLLDRFGGRVTVPEFRKRLIANADPMSNTPKLVGLRSQIEIDERVEALRKDARENPISSAEVSLLERILALKAKSPDALLQLREFVLEMPVLQSAVDGMSARLDALDKRGIDVSDLDFEAGYGRTSMEYYDGFVFGFYAEGQSNLPPLATGGRYDALTRVLGRGRSIPAVGGVIRPALLCEVQP